MTDFFCTIEGQRVTRMTVHVPWSGVWYADADLADEVTLSGRVEIRLGNLALSGTIQPSSSGSFGLSSKVRIVAGAGGWQRHVEAKSYHSDAGIKAVTVLQDAARQVGETLGTVQPPRERIGIDYVRSAGPASRVLDQLVGSRWWVDYAGITHVGHRPTSQTSGYELLEFDARSKVATLAVDDASTVTIGSIIQWNSLPEPVQIRELEIVLDEDKLRVRAWCGGSDNVTNRIASALQAITRAETSKRYHGIYRYRVFKMNGDRVECQVADKSIGLPDVLPISMFPGTPGVWADLKDGSSVLVQFIDGNPTQPIVTHYSPKGDDRFQPALLTIDADEIKLNGGSLGVARQTDSVVAGPFGGTITTASLTVKCG